LRKLNNNSGVAEVSSLVFILAIESIIISVTIFGLSETIDSRIERLGELQAQIAVNSVTDAITDAVSSGTRFPNLMFTRVVEVPETLGGRPYYITVNNTIIFANSTDGQISVSGTTFSNEELDFNIYGMVYVYSSEVIVEYKNEEIVLKYV